MERRLTHMEQEPKDDIRMNQIQVIGTHNSYHIQPEPELMAELRALHSEAWKLEYTHRPLMEQLSCGKVRQLEFDVYADPEGGLFSRRGGLALLGRDTDSGVPELTEPGFKVLHIPDVDYRTHCHTLVEGLETVRSWSLAHPRHVPLMILMDVKGSHPFEIPSVAMCRPIDCGTKELDELDREIRSVFEESHLITPDQIRADYPTLEKGVFERGWPPLGEARGKILFSLDDPGRIREAYLFGRSSLERRVMFVSSKPGRPSAAFVKVNDPTGANEALIRDYVEAGLLVRTMADPLLSDIRSGNTSRRAAALRSGAHFISTDYRQSGLLGYQVSLPGAESHAARPNPVNGPDDLEPPTLEDL